MHFYDVGYLSHIVHQRSSIMDVSVSHTFTVKSGGIFS